MAYSAGAGVSFGDIPYWTNAVGVCCGPSGGSGKSRSQLSFRILKVLVGLDQGPCVGFSVGGCVGGCVGDGFQVHGSRVGFSVGTVGIAGKLILLYASFMYCGGGCN